MSSSVISELADLAQQLERQLRFYADLGVADIGGGLKERAASVTKREPPALKGCPPIENEHAYSGQDTMDRESTDTHSMSLNEIDLSDEPTVQASLFGEATASSEQRSQRPKGPQLPILESKDTSLADIREDLGDCVRCKLHRDRTNIVFGEGNPHARLVFVGEGPGADEDRSGRPFVGRAGQLLNKIIESIGMKREEVYICNIVKCRPPGNRAPERDETATCESFLFRQLGVIRPRVIVVLGSPALQCVLRSRDTITRSRGQWRDWNGIRVMPTFHPAYLLRSPDKKREVWEDMKKVREYLNSPNE